jgi:hypothetical protein
VSPLLDFTDHGNNMEKPAFLDTKKDFDWRGL